jgi:hypothetical protein
MAKIWLDWSDGRYSTRLLTDEEAQEREAKDLDVVHLEDTLWEAYRRDCERDAIWQAFWRSISNEQYMRRREKELMPLEDAEREIRRLKDDLERSQRMEKFYEEHYMKTLNEKHRQTHDEFTCVYPQPGCQIEALPEEWREDAQDILDQYRTDRMEDGLKYQGCCCGHRHKLLDEAAQQTLRSAGFLVENDTESYET